MDSGRTLCSRLGDSVMLASGSAGNDEGSGAGIGQPLATKACGSGATTMRLMVSRASKSASAIEVTDLRFFVASASSSSLVANVSACVRQRLCVQHQRTRRPVEVCQ